MKQLFFLSLALAVTSFSAARAADMDQRIHDAIHILDERQGSADPIPAEILQNAKGIAICTILKGGIGVGGQGGEGIVVIRHLSEGVPPVWRAPSAFNISGASLGAQFGFSSISYIIVLNTDRAIGQFFGRGKVKLDATATGTAGADTGVQSESTRDLERRDVLVYRESGGLYGGATLGGSTIEVKNEINEEAYGEHIHVRDILEGKVAPPPNAQRLYDLLDGKRE